MKVTCVHCSATIHLGLNADLSRVRCPDCNESFPIPSDETLDVIKPGPPATRIRLQAQTEIGEFRLIKSLGMSAICEVWQALQTDPSRLVTLKLSAAVDSPGPMVSKVAREASILGRLNHPAIVKWLGTGEADQYSFLAMEFVDGVPLSQWRLSSTPTPFQAAKVVVKIAGALDHAHQRGIIHRDLTSHNVLIDVSNEPHVIDFGVAASSQESDDADRGYIVGTPLYMSPEQVRADRSQIDHRTDIYSLGVILYELLTGVRPFASGTQLIDQILHAAPVPPIDIDPSIPQALSAACLRCLQKEPRDRYPTARELSDAIDQAIKDPGVAPLGRDKQRETTTPSPSDPTDVLKLQITELERKVENRTRALIATKSEYDVYRTLVESLPIGVFRKDLHDYFVFANRSFCQILGRPISQVVGQLATDVWQLAPSSETEQADKRAIATNRAIRSTEIYSDTAFDVIWSPVRNLSGRIVGVQGLMFDVSTHTETEDTLLREKEEAVAANQAKGDFLARMSHEIRTPMAAIVGMQEVLTDTALDEKQASCVQAIGVAANSLRQIIDDILDFSKVDAGKLGLDFSNFDVRGICDDVVGMLGDSAKKKGLTLECHVASDVPPWMIGDGVRLGQVLVNLASNGVKFTATGGVKLQVTCSHKSSEYAQVSFFVEDTGSGISKSQLTKIFKPFEQADTSRSRAFGGTGLGLAIASKIVQLMGGSLTVESQMGRGSKFSFTLSFSIPVNAVTTPTSPSDSTAKCEQIRDAFGALEILVVDDAIPNQSILEHMLEKGGHRVTLAGNGSEAIRSVHDHDFDLILMDIQMSGMDGFETTRRIRASRAPHIKRLPIIALTAHAMKGDREQCIRNGMSGYASKPIDWHDLYDEIGRVLESNQAPADHLFDPTEFASRLGVDESAVQSLAADFLKCIPEMLDNVIEAISQRDAATLGRAAHRLRGAIANLLGSDSVAPFPDLKTIVEQDNFDRADHIESELTKLVQKIELELSDYLARTCK